MKKLMLMFPGVGSQYTGMGHSFYKGYPVFKETFEQASHFLEKAFTSLCFDGKNKNEWSFSLSGRIKDKLRKYR